MKKINLNYKTLALYICNKGDAEDKAFVVSKKDAIFQILLEAYESIGSCGIYRNPKHMLQSVERYKIVMDEFGNIYAVATYRIMPTLSSYKCTLIGANKSFGEEAKSSVKCIIKSDIANFKHLYWIEASGPIAHWEEKYGVYKIPAVYAVSILKTNNKDIDFIPGDDYQYIRMIKGLDDPQKKTMFGFPSEEMFENLIVKEGYDQYVEHLKRLLGSDYDLLKEAWNKTPVPKSEMNNIIDAMMYVVDTNNVQRYFCNVTRKCYDVMYYMLKKAEYILRYNRHLMSDMQRRGIHSLYYEYKTIFLEASVMEPVKLF